MLAAAHNAKWAHITGYDAGMAKKRKVHVGTSGWIYDDWSGPFYPEGVKGTDRLIYYATQFHTVELNASFYRVPSEAAIRSWNKRLKPGFHFVVKGPRTVTHYRRLKDCGEPLRFFLDRVLQLESLRVILWQLPPSLHKNLGLLDNFLAGLPESVRHAVEFRHESWWDEEVESVLRRHNAAFVAVSHPALPEDVRPTTDFLYLRFHGRGKVLYDYDYARRELSDWVKRVQPHLRGRQLYAFFNNDYNAYAPKNALLLSKLF